jgi:hypothetical protein
MKSLTAEEFVKIWQSCASPKEIEIKLGCKYECAYQRARAYRKRGVNLKRFQRTNKGIDWEMPGAYADNILSKVEGRVDPK